MTAPKGEAWMDRYAEPRTLARVGRRRRLNLDVMGEGSPTVILSIGFAGGSFDWIRVQPFVARFTRVVSFDHAGIGFSDPGRHPRTSSAIVADLRAALASAGIGPPYVLVGHSAGGLHMRLFAAVHPDEVSGLVLVDAPMEDWQQRMHGGPNPGMAQSLAAYRRMLVLARTGALGSDDPDYQAQAGLPNPDLTPAMNVALHRMWTSQTYLRTLVSEGVEMGRRSAAELAAAPRSLGDLPLIVLSAGHIDRSPITEGDPELVRRWYGMHDELASLSTRGVRRTVDSGHLMPIEAPRAVVAAIEEVVEMARRSRSICDLTSQSSTPDIV